MYIRTIVFEKVKFSAYRLMMEMLEFNFYLSKLKQSLLKFTIERLKI